MDHQRAPQLAPCKITNKCNVKSVTNYYATVENMDGVNTDKLFEAIEVEFENIMDQESSNEKIIQRY